MNILALDTSTDYCSVALSVAGETHVRERRAGQSHSSHLLQMIDELMHEGYLRIADLDAIAYGEGPGSFTGLRITCGVVQGLAFAADLPVVGIGTLLAMAAGCRAERVVCCVDARVHEIYHGAYCYAGGAAGKHGERSRSDASDRFHGWQVVHPPSVCAPAAAPALEGEGWVGCGNGFAIYSEALEARYGHRLVRVEAERYPHAREIASLAAPLVERGEVVSAERAVPVYLRDRVALRIDERANR